MIIQGTKMTINQMRLAFFQPDSFGVGASFYQIANEDDNGGGDEC
jgi:hypothetical protein